MGCPPAILSSGWTHPRTVYSTLPRYAALIIIIWSIHTSTKLLQRGKTEGLLYLHTAHSSNPHSCHSWITRIHSESFALAPARTAVAPCAARGSPASLVLCHQPAVAARWVGHRWVGAPRGDPRRRDDGYPRHAAPGLVRTGRRGQAKPRAWGGPRVAPRPLRARGLEARAEVPRPRI